MYKSKTRSIGSPESARVQQQCMVRKYATDQVFRGAINYWNWWTTTNGKTRFTDCRNGSLEFQGWGKDGHEFYNNTYKQIQKQRLDEELNQVTDALFLKKASKKYKDVLNTMQRNNAAASEVIEGACMDEFRYTYSFIYINYMYLTKYCLKYEPEKVYFFIKYK